jgi:ABC-type branched-subunit amino acid transport system ATPase component
MSAAICALELEGVSSGYGEAIVVRNLDLQVRKGEIFAILGKNGMGKSTLLKTVMGFLRAAAGRIRLLGDEVADLPTHLVARRPIAYAPQEKTLFQDLTVEENLRLGLRSERDFAQRLDAVSDPFPVIRQRLKQKAGTLSGGEQKMLLVIRALLSAPQVILVDEISEGLQPSVVQRLAEVLRTERNERGVAILLVEQNVPFALSIADRYAVLNIGEIVDRGDAAAPESRARIESLLAV